MAVLALILLVAWMGLVTGVRAYVHVRSTGQAPIQFHDRRGSPQWWSRIISSLGVAFAVAAPFAELAGLPPISPLDHPVLPFGGVALMVLGITGTVGAQTSMGASWRADVDPDARTSLVTSGPYRWVRNPILSWTAVTAVGYALLVPNVLALMMLIAFIAAMHVQVRLVEEPYLARVHGDAYRRYTAGTGRFLPRVKPRARE